MGQNCPDLTPNLTQILHEQKCRSRNLNNTWSEKGEKKKRQNIKKEFVFKDKKKDLFAGGNVI